MTSIDGSPSLRLYLASVTRRPLTKAMISAVASIAIVAVWLTIDYRTHPRLLAGPMVQMLTPNSLTLVWSLHPSRPAVVRIANTDNAGEREVPASQSGDRWIATIDGLNPGTQYTYRIVTTGPWNRSLTLVENPVRTAPSPGTAFRFIAFGDSGNASYHQRRIARLLPACTPDIIIHTGDLVYDAGAPEDYPAKFYRPYASLIACVPFYPCLGNHDVRTGNGRPFLDAFIPPCDGPRGEENGRFYWFDFGDARFIALDTNCDYTKLHQLVAPWLDSVLAGAGDRWRILFMHEPIYTNGHYGMAEKLADSINDLLDRHRVSLVLTGHNHMYERTRPLRDGRPVAHDSGTVHITTAAGGAHLYSVRPVLPAYMAVQYNEEHSFTLADVTSTLISLRQINEHNQIIDEYQITRPAPAMTQPATTSAPG